MAHRQLGGAKLLPRDVGPAAGIRGAPRELAIAFELTALLAWRKRCEMLPPPFAGDMESAWKVLDDVPTILT